MKADERMPRARSLDAREPLDELLVARDPFDQFDAWFGEVLATQTLVEPYAMTLATAGPEGAPSARIVLLRGYDRRGFAFFTNYESRKGRELAATGRAALLFYWAALERQIRIEGSVACLPPADSDAYFAQRPRGHRLAAWASAQSRSVPDRAFLEARVHAEEERFREAEIPRPPYWGGYRLAPRAYEFWQGRPNRMHDRIVYRAAEDGWRIDRLSP